MARHPTEAPNPTTAIITDQFSTVLRLRNLGLKKKKKDNHFFKNYKIMYAPYRKNQKYRQAKKKNRNLLKSQESTFSAKVKTFFFL